VHQPSRNDRRRARAHDGNIHHGHARLRVTGEEAGSPERVRHTSYEHIVDGEVRAPQLARLGRGHVPIRSISPHAIADVRELRESNFAIRVLILGLDPVAVDEKAVRANQVANCSACPALR
jgi:hypothetical protein